MKKTLLFPFATLLLFTFNACEQEMPVDCNLSAPNLLILNITDATCGNEDGEISLSASGGEAPYTFNLGAASNQEGRFPNLMAGEYLVDVVDANGCQTSDSARIQTGLTYANDIQAIIETNCAVPGCHVPGNQNIDFLNPQNVIGRGVSLQFQIDNNQMPPDTAGITLSAADKEKIACWVEDGEPE